MKNDWIISDRSSTPVNLLTLPFPSLVLHITLVIKELSLACKGSMQCNLFFMNNWSDWQADTNSLRDLGQLVPLHCTHESRNTETRTLLFCRMLQCTSSSAIFNHLSNPGLECQGFIFTLTVIMAAPLVFLLAQHKPHPCNKCKVLVVCVPHSGCVHGGREGVEGVEYLPWGYGKEITERQWSTEQQQTGRGRKSRNFNLKIPRSLRYFHEVKVDALPALWLNITSLSFAKTTLKHRFGVVERLPQHILQVQHIVQHLCSKLFSHKPSFKAD